MRSDNRKLSKLLGFEFSPINLDRIATHKKIRVSCNKFRVINRIQAACPLELFKIHSEMQPSTDFGSCYT